ncbi:hypothetical protein K435DRAFT_367261 [Dendrothele bispora CBS 962.96]|uniref:Uncharacterized protein n=1 Tax=Dendrothele bispora (strain CBS 962.96) TaxID=1314807 RepID=A0A4S8LCE3_DENBC|nr:hypothetical protein K435DRAFT_367261 [Dendrothele bispora CBS 962.96]
MHPGTRRSALGPVRLINSSSSSSSPPSLLLIAEGPQLLLLLFLLHGLSYLSWVYCEFFYLVLYYTLTFLWYSRTC